LRAAVTAAVFGDTLWDVLKSVHVLCAAFWVGGGFVLNVAVNLSFLARDPARQSMILRTTEVIGQRLFTPLALIVVAVGVWMVLRYDDVYDFGDFWISYGLGFFVLTFLVGAGFLGPRSRKTAELIDSGAGEDEVRHASVPLRMVAAIDAVLLWSVVVVMVVKPT
jgi:uncharacterized membrane protein